MTGRLLALGLLLPGLLLSASALAAPRIAIIIVDLPAPVTCAVIPFSPHARRLAERASLAGKEVLVHMPMAAQRHQTLDQGGLRDGMDEPQLLDAVRQALSQIPQARGLNNHMGSALTEQQQPSYSLWTAVPAVIPWHSRWPGRWGFPTPGAMSFWIMNAIWSVSMSSSTG